MANWGDVTGLNRGYVLELYERFRRDPGSVDADTRELFARWTPPVEGESEPADEAVSAGTASTPVTTDSRQLRKVVGAVNFAQSIRRYGHLAVRLDPLGVRAPIGDPSLLPEWHGVTEDDLRQLPATLVRSPLADGASTMAEVVDA